MGTGDDGPYVRVLSYCNSFFLHYCSLRISILLQKLIEAIWRRALSSTYSIDGILVTYLIAEGDGEDQVKGVGSETDNIVDDECKVCHAAACGRRSHTGVLADADSIPTRTTSALSIYLYSSFRTRQWCQCHHRVLIPPPIDIATHSPREHHSLDHARTVLPSHCPFPSLLRHRPAIPSLRHTASNLSARSQILVDAAHTRRGLPSANIDGFRTLPVSSNYYCSLFLARFLFFFWHPQFLTSRLPPVLSPFAFYVSFHPLPLTCSPSLLCAPARAFTYTLIR